MFLHLNTNAGFCWQSLGEMISCYDGLFWLRMPGTAAGMLSGKREYSAGMMGLFICLCQEVCWFGSCSLARHMTGC